MYIRGKTFAEKYAEQMEEHEQRQKTDKRKTQQKLTAAQLRKAEQSRRKIAQLRARVADQNSKQIRTGYAIPEEAEIR